MNGRTVLLLITGLLLVPVVGVIAASPDELFNVGVSLQYQGRYTEAIELFDQVVVADPEFAAAWCYRGKALAGLLQYDEALESLDKALEINPDYSLAWSSKAEILLGMKRFAEAAWARSKVAALGPL